MTGNPYDAPDTKEPGQMVPWFRIASAAGLLFTVIMFWHLTTLYLTQKDEAQMLRQQLKFERLDKQKMAEDLMNRKDGSH